MVIVSIRYTRPNTATALSLRLPHNKAAHVGSVKALLCQSYELLQGLNL